MTEVERQLQVFDTQAAREHGRRAVQGIRMIERAVEIARAQGAPCLPEWELKRLALLAIADAKIAARHARRAGIGR